MTDYSVQCNDCGFGQTRVPLIMAQLAMTRHARRRRHAVGVFTDTGRYVTGWNPERDGTQLTFDDVPPF